MFVSWVLLCNCKTVSALTIVGKVKPKQFFSLFYHGDKMCGFVNNGENDTTIVRHVDIDVLTEFRYGTGYNNKDGKITYVRHTLLLDASDSVVLSKEGYELVPLFSTRQPLFIDKYIDAGSFSLPTTPKIRSKMEYQRFYNNLEFTLKRDSIKIDSLYRLGIITIKERQDWHDFRELTFLAAVYNLLRSENNYLPNGSEEALYQRAMMHFRTRNLDGDIVRAVFRGLKAYFVKKHHEEKLGWVSFYVTNQKVIDKRYIFNAFKDYLLNVQDKTLPRYRESLKQIRAYAISDKDEELIRLCNNNDRIFDFLLLDLLDKNQKSLHFGEIAKKSGKKYFLIDVWASWCWPCRRQIPELKKVKMEFNNADICFVGISTDKEHLDWVNALDKENLSDDFFQFRVDSSSGSYLHKFFNIQTIPRYLLISNSGEVMNNRFYLPNDEHFKSKLREVLEAD